MPPPVRDGVLAFADFLVSEKLPPDLRARYAAVVTTEYAQDPKAAQEMDGVDRALK